MSETTLLDDLSRDLLTEERTILYQFFSEIYYTSQTIEQLHKWKDLLDEEWILNLRETYPAFNEFFSTIEREDLSLLTSQWEKEYQSIFNIYNSEGKIQAPIWESYYTSYDHSLFSKSTFILRNKLHEFGLQYKLENTYPEDHLSVQLDFLNYLIDFTSQAMKNNDYLSYEKGIYNQYWLIKDHLLRWVPLFIKKIELANNQSIYYPLSVLLLEILQEDLDLVKLYKEEIENNEKLV